MYFIFNKILYHQSISNIILKASLHCHFDHTAGTEDLRKKTGCEVIDSRQTEIFRIGNMDIQIIGTPGHTRDSVCYYVKSSDVFLRSDDPEIKSAINKTGAAAAEVFTELRRRKNIFG